MDSPNTSEPTPAGIPELLAVVESLAKAVKMQGRPVLWSVDDIAEWWGVHRKTIYADVICCEDFPAPVQITPNGTRRWVEAEVVKWFLQRRAKAPRPRGKSSPPRYP